MVRFSCFHGHIHAHKPKKTVQNPNEAMVTALETCSKECSLKDFSNSSGTNPLPLRVQIDYNNADDHVLGSSIEQDRKSEGNKSKHNFDSDLGIHKIGSLKKSLSLGSALDKKDRVSGGSDSEGEIDKEYSCDLSNDHCPSVIPVGSKDPGSGLPDLYQETLRSDSVQLNSDVANNESIFSVGVQGHSESEVWEGSLTKLSNHVAYTSPFIVKSKSLTNLSSSILSTVMQVARSRSYEDLNVLNSRTQEILVHEVQRRKVENHERHNTVFNNEEHGFENLANENCNTYDYVGSAGDWIIPVIDEVNLVKTPHTEHLLCPWDQLPNDDFKIKRIEEWVMDIQNCRPSEEMDDLSTYDEHQVQNDDTMVGSSTAKLDVKIYPGMEAAKKYISLLGASSTVAQLANYGLDMIPLLSSFANLRSLNLSGNSIVRITLGALPRGLHSLNLSRNNISIIEGLRELTRLRVLDLSYNRIFRIGHGLASCTSLKELYLSGNKISEVDGLHRLLKLIVLDLRFNKISTSKSLGQLAANYNSLQAISLEGNPAQKNVGDEQLKKYLLGLLPHLHYYNMQSIKVGTLKDVADRSARLSLSSHQIDRGLRSDLKSMRMGNHGRKTQATASRYTSRSRHIYPPPVATKPTTHQNNVNDFNNKLLSFKANLSIRRSRSEGTLGVL